MRTSIVWQKSSFSGADEGNSCVEIAPLAGAVLLRESDDPGVIVTTTPAALRAFLRDVRAGAFDILR
ncbi:DUF397 domain-containing protein [Streptomyces sp. SID13666]|uniref:DUF397 domain-containing protein n=1 Tax=unclassified Streptomyces TaxID=2593676 RepID=UPI0013C1EDD7|nr:MULTISPECIES: DUF397 domain-containing protein [unclassified Streptomyces]NEA58104.1 DUF397 domain-containing protein [Streptomyces sp. SID13666]NEA74108.1 DUF397 domain-containing protein [Streptomyces sp. SID13588]